MSGICGIIRLNGKTVKNYEIENMLDSMHNRGNDAVGIYIDDSIGFGHKMLWTTTESLYEEQPLISADSTLILVADARIDNREDLICELKIERQDSKIITDIDLILWAYKKWADDCSEYLIGDYAFAIWDKKEQKLLCSRSAIGIKPFYYYLDKDSFIFASEISTIQRIAPSIVLEPDIISVKNLINTMVIPCENTCFNKIMRLIPAHNLIIVNKKISKERFWFPENIKIDKNISFEDAKSMFLKVMKIAISTRLRSAYSIGCELSGGLDSSTIITLAKSLDMGKDIYPLSSYYGNLECDESNYIQSVAKQLKIKPLINNALSLDYQNEFSLQKNYQISSDWPGSGSFLDNMGVFKLAKENNVRVVLTGQGGDHVVTGNYFMLADYLQSFRFIQFYKEMKYLKFTWRVVKNYAVAPLLPLNFKKYIKYIRGNNLQKNISQTDYCFSIKNLDESSYAQSFDLGIIMGLGSSLWADFSPQLRAGFFDIEYRHPFFDQRVIELMLSLPPEYKILDGVSKIILRESMKGKLPDMIYQRQDKAEFSPIIMYQMKYLNIPELLEFENLKKYAIIPIDEIEYIKRNYSSNADKIVPFTLKVWRLLYIEEWLNFQKEKNEV